MHLDSLQTSCVFPEKIKMQQNEPVNTMLLQIQCALNEVGTDEFSRTIDFAWS